MERAEVGDTSSLGNLTRRRLVVRALVHDGYKVEEIAAKWNAPRERIAADLTAPLVDPEHRAAELWDRVLAELKETPEPGRYVEPKGEQRVPGETYPIRS